MFGKSEHDEGNKLRIELLKEHIRKNYNMFYDELSWISENQDFLKEQDKEEKESTCYFDRLKEDVFGLNNECYTELNSLVELWGTKIDQISAIKEGEKSDSRSIPNKETVRAKILTQVRINCLEYLAQNLGLIAAPGDSTTTRPEIQGVVRGQCASALNVPGYGGIPQGREQMLDDKYDLVYKTNLLSSIMNVESIAQAAIGFAGTLSEDVFRNFTEQFDYEVTYKECCKILDRSARCKLKKDKRPFDERFKSIKNEVRQDDELEEGDKDVLIKWYEECTTKKKFSDICEIMSMCISNMKRYEKVLPELYLNSEDRFGYFTFIKYLVDEKIITLID